MSINVLWGFSRVPEFAKSFFRSPKKTVYQLIKSVYWSLPLTIRNKLQGVRFKFISWVKKQPVSASPICRKRGVYKQDISWEEFASKVLSRRGEYKGVLIQEAIIDWNVPLYQRPQHIATAFGSLGYLVIYKTDGWSNDNVEGFREVSKNVWITNRYEADSIENVVRSFYSTAYALTPEMLMESGKRGVMVYEYIDHIDEQISGDSDAIKRLLNLKEFAFTGGVDFIVASAGKLEQEAIDAVGKHKVISVPNGVDTRHYRNPAHQKTVLPEELISFRKNYENIVGYFGALAPWLWYDVITELAESRPDLGFVFIGPDYNGGVQHLPKLDNVLYLGQVEYKILPAYAQQFDICFIPFTPGEIARTTSPLKLFEYFALEKPVVVTSEMAECVAYKEVLSGDSAQSLSKAIDEAIKLKQDSSFMLRLRQLADENNWDERAKKMKVIFDALTLSTENNLAGGKDISLNDIQSVITDCHREDSPVPSYYEIAYRKEEELYWQPVPQWLKDLGDIDSVIDVGAAYGTLLLFTSLINGSSLRHAVDPVGYMSSALKQKYGIESFSMDFERDETAAFGQYDLILFTEVIEHLNFYPVPTLLKIKKLMHADSRLIITTPDSDEWGLVTDYYNSLDEIPEYDGQQQTWIDGHIWQYSKDELESVFTKAGLEIEKFDYAPGVTARHLCYQLKIKA